VTSTVGSEGPIVRSLTARPVTFAVVDVGEFLGIEQVGDNTWRLAVTEKLITPGQFLFGGAALAAGLVALEADSGRPTIWATAQYPRLRPDSLGSHYHHDQRGGRRSRHPGARHDQP
jgi:hypothetical protein